MTTYTASYTTVDNLLMMAPIVGSMSSVTSAVLCQYIYQAEAVINAKLSRNYAIPIASPIMEGITNDIALYNIFSKRMITNEAFNKSPWPNVFKAAMETVDAIADGTISLVDSAGALLQGTTQSVPWSNTQQYSPTMGVDAMEYSRVSSQRASDTMDARQ